MSNYQRISTSPEVWAVIRARHHADLRVFESYSAPEGDHFGDPCKGRMCTAYGFPGGSYPLMMAETTWDITEQSHVRQNEQHQYWLCIPQKDDD